MIRYAARALPWGLVVTSLASVVGLMVLVAGWPWTMWPLQGTAVGLLAGIAAWSMDERAASVVDTLPKAFWWRTAARAVVVPLSLLAWTSCLLAMRDRIPDHLGLFLLQGAGASALALGVTVHQRASGCAEPGRACAAVVIPTASAVALIRPVAHWLPLFPLWPDDNWSLSLVIWSATGLASMAVILVASLPAAGRRSASTASGAPRPPRSRTVPGRTGRSAVR